MKKYLAPLIGLILLGALGTGRATFQACGWTPPTPTPTPTPASLCNHTSGLLAGTASATDAHYLGPSENADINGNNAVLASVTMAALVQEPNPPQTPLCFDLANAVGDHDSDLLVAVGDNDGCDDACSDNTGVYVVVRHGGQWRVALNPTDNGDYSYPFSYGVGIKAGTGTIVLSATDSNGHFGVWTSTDYGVTWAWQALLNSGTTPRHTGPVAWVSEWSLFLTSAYLSGSTGYAWTSPDGGTWTQYAFGSTDHFNDIFDNGAHVFLVGSGLANTPSANSASTIVRAPVSSTNFGVLTAIGHCVGFAEGGGCIGGFHTTPWTTIWDTTSSRWITTQNAGVETDQTVACVTPPCKSYLGYSPDWLTWTVGTSSNAYAPSGLFVTVLRRGAALLAGGEAGSDTGGGGGQGVTLAESTDNGATWAMVGPTSSTAGNFNSLLQLQLASDNTGLSAHGFYGTGFSPHEETDYSSDGGHSWGVNDSTLLYGNGQHSSFQSPSVQLQPMIKVY